MLGRPSNESGGLKLGILGVGALAQVDDLQGQSLGPAEKLTLRKYGEEASEIGPYPRSSKLLKQKS